MIDRAMDDANGKYRELKTERNNRSMSPAIVFALLLRFQLSLCVVSAISLYLFMHSR